MTALALTPRIPVAVEQPVVDPRLDLALLALGVALAVAGVIAAIGIDLRGERQRLSIGRPPQVVGVGGEMRQRDALAAFDGDDVHLRSAVAVGKKRDALAVG